LTPTTIEAAIDVLCGVPEARCLAGGQTLVAMMNANLLRPSALVSLKKIAALRGIAVDPAGAIRIGAMTTHSAVAAFPGFKGAQAIVGAASRRVAHEPIRNAGTIGGSIAHADPAADLPTALVAAAAEIETAGRDGPRRIAAGDFFVDYLETALADAEIVVAIHLPPPVLGETYGYDKLVRIDGDFAIVSAAVTMIVGTDGRPRRLRMVAGACGATPIRSEAAEARLIGSTLADEDFESGMALLVAATNPLDDFRGSAGYRRKVLPRLMRRVLETARRGAA
jgi:carbon-monoxide dehydrogenase medium subunit